jgi:hypothetical protein
MLRPHPLPRQRILQISLPRRNRPHPHPLPRQRNTQVSLPRHRRPIT